MLKLFNRNIGTTVFETLLAVAPSYELEKQTLPRASSLDCL